MHKDQRPAEAKICGVMKLDGVISVKFTTEQCNAIDRYCAKHECTCAQAIRHFMYLGIWAERTALPDAPAANSELESSHAST